MASWPALVCKSLRFGTRKPIVRSGYWRELGAWVCSVDFSPHVWVEAHNMNPSNRACRRPHSASTCDCGVRSQSGVKRIVDQSSTRSNSFGITRHKTVRVFSRSELTAVEKKLVSRESAIALQRRPGSLLGRWRGRVPGGAPRINRQAIRKNCPSTLDPGRSGSSLRAVSQPLGSTPSPRATYDHK